MTRAVGLALMIPAGCVCTDVPLCNQHRRAAEIMTTYGAAEFRRGVEAAAKAAGVVVAHRPNPNGGIMGKSPKQIRDEIVEAIRALTPETPA